jgi:hypothetical protein
LLFVLEWLAQAAAAAAARESDVFVKYSTPSNALLLQTWLHRQRDVAKILGRDCTNVSGLSRQA